MKKKTYIFTAVALALLLPSCQQETLDQTGEAPSPADYIQFGTPTVILNTESRSITKDALNAGDAFGVLGYCVPYQRENPIPNYNSGSDSWSTKRRLCYPDVFDKQPVKVTSNGCQYDFNEEGQASTSTNYHPKSWYKAGTNPEGGSNSTIPEADDYKYTFIGYYPYANYFDITYKSQYEDGTDYGAPVLTFTMPQTGGDNLNHNDTPDAMLGVLYDRTKNEGNVNFNFSHMLTALGFEVNNYSEDRDLIIHSVKLSGSFYKKITVDFTTSPATIAFPTDRYTGTYTLLNEDLQLGHPEEGEITKSSDLLGGEHLLLISGEENKYFGEDVKVTIEYTFGNEANKTYSASRPGTFTPQPGVKYTAQLNFVGDTFILQFVVDNNETWEDGGSDNDDDILPE